jgi:methionyl-tRNA synthetase
MGSLFITTPIYYVNDVPHVGHAYCTINDDAIARWHRLVGEDVLFSTGTDEHGLKVARTAEAAGKSPQEFVDSISPRFRECWELLDIDYDDFIRTTEPRHAVSVSKFLQMVYDNGFIEKRAYKGFYSVADEEYITADQVDDYNARGRTVIEAEEDNYFFLLSKFEDRLIEWIEANPDLIVPTSKRKEVLGFIKGGLQDFSISRASIDWGIPIPWDPSQVTYVWFDALINYLTVAGFGSDDPRDVERFAKFWPVVNHVMAKDILRFHCIMWPAMLMAAGLTPPARYGITGYLLVGGEKMSKTSLNAIAPAPLVEEFGVDAVRYHFLRDVNFGNDGDFSYEGMLARYNSDLANNLGNLFSRVASVIDKKCGGIGPKPGFDDPAAKRLRTLAQDVFDEAHEAWSNLQPHHALEATFKLVREANAILEETEPWKSEPGPELDALLGNMCETLRIIALLAYPAMPRAMTTLWNRLGLSGNPGMQRLPEDLIWGGYPGSVKVEKGEPLFPRLTASAE